MFFQKKKKYKMDMSTANAALQNILAACDQAPNTIPFDKLVLRQKADTLPYNRLIVLTSLLLFFTFLSPLLVVPAATYIAEITAPEPVVMVNDYVEDNILYLEFTGDNIIYEQAYMEMTDGTRVEVLSYDIQKGLISFPYDATQEANIYIPIEDNQPLHFLLTPQP